MHDREPLTVTDPSTGDVIEELAFHSGADIDRWLAEAARLDIEASLPKWRRIEILNRAAGLLRDRQDAFGRRIAREGGKPLRDALVEADRAAAGLEAAARVLAGEAGREIPLDLSESTRGRTAFTVHEPIGPVVAISAFNHPLNLIVHQVAPAVAAACPVIVKPALTTPLSCLALVELLKEAGLPEDFVRVAITDNAISEQLTTDPRVAFFTFIGSARVGWMLRSKLSPGTRCALEHGGAAPALVEADADLDKAIPRLLKGGYYHAGQVCVSVQRIFVHRDILEAFIDRWAGAVEGLKVGDASEAATDVGPLILPREVDRVASWVAEARSSGAEVLLGGEKVSDRFYSPTVVQGPAPYTKLASEEVFGPVTVLFPYEDWREAVAQANALPWSFQAAVFTEQLGLAHTIAHALAGSAVMVNDHTAFRADWMPFAGRRQSGLGTGGIDYTFHDLRPEKMIVTHWE